ncbi:guanylate kinase [Thiolinea disciformis]|uniref:guanylate kinase n=1 Tax=Thiolinea disciformis TaxID=125614 RepID=UPI00036F8218|nr:guanylate kinase [Thiolinea disciformis]
MKPGQLYIVSAPSGAGKTSLMNALCARLNYVKVSVSHTTRKPRPGEENGVHYHFVDVETFQREIEQGLFLEYAKVFDNYYGTSRVAVQTLLDAGVDVILEIDWQGARLVKSATEEVVSIFILPPSREALEQRLRARNQDDEAVIQRRMRDARQEMSHYDEYDYLVINDDFGDTLENLLAIFNSHRLQLARQVQHHQAVLNNLLQEPPSRL